MSEITTLTASIAGQLRLCRTSRIDADVCPFCGTMEADHQAVVCLRTLSQRVAAVEAENQRLREALEGFLTDHPEHGFHGSPLRAALKETP